MSDLTAKEQENVRGALRYLRARYGTWENVAQSVGMKSHGLRLVVAGRPVSASLAFRVARRARSTMDDVLSGRFPGGCPRCGQAVPAGELGSTEVSARLACATIPQTLRAE